jgi:cell division protein FtsB
MRDIGTRIQRYRLSRYAAPGRTARRSLRWFWLAAALWLIWAGFVSEHNFVRLGRLARERARGNVELKRLHGQVAALDARLRDPAAQRELTEHALREKAGMARPGEIVYHIRTVSGAPQATAPRR